MKDLLGRTVDLESLEMYDIVYLNDFILVYAGKNKYGTRVYEVVYDIQTQSSSGGDKGVVTSVPKKYLQLNLGCFWGYDGFEDNCILLGRLNGKRTTLNYISQSYKHFDYTKFKNGFATSVFSAEIKTEVLQIVDAFELGEYKCLRSFKEVKFEDGSIFVETLFETSTGTYTHYFKVRECSE